VEESLRGISAPQCREYQRMMSRAFELAPPPFFKNWFGRRYFELARRADWFANSLIANAALEGYGATQIWKFSTRVTDGTCADAIRQHSLDESRHSTMFISMLRLAFPGMEFSEETARSIDDLQPRYSRHHHPPTVEHPEPIESVEALMSELVQVHITEIRALVLQHLLRPVLLAYAPNRSVSRLSKFSDRLISDEARHIHYTADIFERACADGMRDCLFELFETHVRAFNDLTLVELERDAVAI
jgi:hypothetical protein